MAWVFFVHPHKLAMVYTKNPEVARAIADQATRITAEYDSLRQRVAVNTGNDDIKAAVENLTTSLHDAAERSKELSAAGVPLGWPSAVDRVAE